MSKKYTTVTAEPSTFFSTLPDPTAKKVNEESSDQVIIPTETAIVYCEGHFGGIDGKTANALVRRSEKYKILSVIDSEKCGVDSGKILDDSPNGIPVFRDLGTALAQAGRLPNHFIFGITTETGILNTSERRVILRAIGYGMNIANSLHEFLNNDPEFAAAAAKSNIVIHDV